MRYEHGPGHVRAGRLAAELRRAGRDGDPLIDGATLSLARLFGVPARLIIARAEWDRLRRFERYRRRHAGRVAPRRRNRHGRTGVRRG